MADAPLPRPLPLVETAIRRLLAARATKRAARDRREKDMLLALRDVETLEGQIAADDAALEELFQERDQALARPADAPASS